MTETTRYWMRMIALNAAAALLVAVAFNGVTWSTPWRRALEVFSIGFLFASVIGSMCAFVVPRLARAVACHLRFPVDWIVLIAAMAMLGIVGSALAIGVLRAVGYIPSNELAAQWFAGSLKGS